jgi:Tol biopolymer transport system component
MSYRFVLSAWPLGWFELVLAQCLQDSVDPSRYALSFVARNKWRRTFRRELHFQVTNSMTRGTGSSRGHWLQPRVLVAGVLVLFTFIVQYGESNTNKAPYNVGRVTEPQLFAEGIVSTEDDEVGGTFTPDGSEFYFVKLNPYTTFPHLGMICVSRFRGGRWTVPEVVPFSGRNLDFPPKISPDGKTMYFSSSRPAPGKTARVLRIWAVARAWDEWGEPRVLPAPINAEDSWNWAPSVTNDGTLYFASNRDGQKAHIFRSRLVNESYVQPERLGPEINSEFNESDPYISPDEKTLIFSSFGNDLGDADRAETLKGGGVLYARADLYISTNREGKWLPARHLRHSINSVADEGSPSLTADGKYLFFTSERSPFTVPTARRFNYDEIEAILHSTLNGHGNIFFISSEALDTDETGGRK